MSDDGFLSRWSRRKLAEKNVEAPQEEFAAEADIEPEKSITAEDVEDVVDADEESSPPPRHPAEDIDIDSLTKDSDFTIFMQKGVPTAVRRLALRKLWRSDPVLANLDGLNDYEDMDYTYGISTVARTNWKIGRGFLTDKDLGIEPEPEEAAPTDAEVADDAEAGTTEVAETDGEVEAEPETPEETAPGIEIIAADEDKSRA
jgi:hypothetical protein